jgi:ABC-type Fe3+ transport system permease subunit
VIERAIEDAIMTVDQSLEEGSYALGATKYQTIRGITLPVALSGIMTGIILGFGRAAEESAVVILTAGYTQFMPELAIRANPKFIFGMKIYPAQDLIASLPYAVYHAYENSNVIPLSNGFAAAFVLICVVLVINLAARVVLHLGMNRRRGFPDTGRLVRFFAPRRVDRVVEPIGTSPETQPACPFRELELEQSGNPQISGNKRIYRNQGQKP